jgi:acetyl esterase/lipase
MVRRISLAVIAAVIALAVINKDRLMTKLRGAASSKIANTADKAAADKPGTADKAAADKSAADKAAADKPAEPKTLSLPGLRKSLKTTIEGERDETPAPEPPAGELEKVTYDAPLGKNVAYITPVKPGARGPAIIWIHGGFGWGIDDFAWAPSPRTNDQSASGFRKAGIAEMYPALRGGSQNPGKPECFLGEIDDILAAADFLAKRTDVDPKRIYLGGHSTGGLMVILAAESSPRFRTVFAFGPVADPRQYGKSGCMPAGAGDNETRARSAIEFLFEIGTPTYVIDGANGNAGVFPMMKKRSGNAPITYLTIPDADHFNTLAPGIDVVAKAILADTGEKPAIHITADAIQAAMRAN